MGALDDGFREELTENDVPGDNTLACLVWDQEKVCFGISDFFNRVCLGSVIMEARG